MCSAQLILLVNNTHLPFTFLFYINFIIWPKQVSCNKGHGFKALELVNVLKSYLSCKRSFMKLPPSFIFAYRWHHHFGRSWSNHLISTTGWLANAASGLNGSKSAMKLDKVISLWDTCVHVDSYVNPIRWQQLRAVGSESCSSIHCYTRFKLVCPGTPISPTVHKQAC